MLRIDATVAKNLTLLLTDLAARDQKLVFWNWCEDARRTLICYEPSLEMYCRSSSSMAQIFSGNICAFKSGNIPAQKKTKHFRHCSRLEERHHSRMSNT